MTVASVKRCENATIDAPHSLSPHSLSPHSLSPHILVVDDEPGIVDVLTFALTEAGFRTTVATDGPTALRIGLTQQPDLVLLDVMLPGLDGLDVCRQLRAAGRVPIIMLSAKGSEADRVAGLELFADDYIVKPFSLAEVIARIRTVLHRSSATNATARVVPPSASKQLVRGCLVLDLESFEARWDANPIELTRLQFDLLALLARRANTVFTREQLLNEVWGATYTDDIRTVDSMVKRLRNKLEEAGAPRDVIESRRDRGYVLRADSLQ
jgi:two-component system, OmpR family, response regulator VicR